MRRAHLIGLALVTGLSVGLLAWAGVHVWGRSQAAVASSAVAGVKIGGPFTLIDQNGRKVTEQDLIGKPTAIFFGFTFCPEICPTTLAALSAWMKALGPDADRLNVVFVTIDPERDRPPQLARYLSSFDPRIRGLTGVQSEIAVIAREYHVYYKKVPLAGGGYTMDHSAAIYLMDPQGRFVGVISYQDTSTRALERLRELVKG